MTTISPSLAQELIAQLERRKAELAARLRGALVLEDAAADVTDFKDMAAAESMSTVADAAGDRASQELAQVTAALRRLEEGHYGACQDCGQDIDPRRLAALPATAFCTSCQAVHERSAVTH